MKRYQVYLDPKVVSILDEAGNMAGINRSKLIQGSLDRFAQMVSRLQPPVGTQPKKLPNLDNLIGIINLKKKGKTTFALRDDSDYLRD